MPVSTKIEPIDRDLKLMLDEELGPEARSKALAAFAREQLAEAQETNRRATGGAKAPPHATTVDGRSGVALETVKPDGTIVFEFELFGEVLEWIGRVLVEESPVRTGRFANSFILLADGVEVPVPGPIPDAEHYVFTNVQPYARKIERGLSPQAPEGVFEAVATVARGRFGNIAAVRFTYVSLLDEPAAGASRAAKEAVRQSRQPAIIVSR